MEKIWYICVFLWETSSLSVGVITLFNIYIEFGMMFVTLLPLILSILLNPIHNFQYSFNSFLFHPKSQMMFHECRQKAYHGLNITGLFDNNIFPVIYVYLIKHMTTEEINQKRIMYYYFILYVRIGDSDTFWFI